jgi:hypothetical protein
LCEADRMLCPLCEERQARRSCPAVGRPICAVCCGTKRQGEIACPADCGWLAAAQAHPPASVKRRQERDLGFVISMREGLSQRESELFWVFLTFLAGYRADPLVRLADDDLAEAAGALAATFETAGRGLIYEHRPPSLAAQRLVTELKAFLGTLVEGADATSSRLVERDAAVVLRRVEKGARDAGKVVDEGPASALGMIGRVVAAAGQARRAAPEEPEGRISPPTPMLIKI